MNNELASAKGLIKGEDKSLYIALQEIYKYLFEVYIFSKVNLKKYDEEIKNSEYYFGKPNPNSKQLISGLREFMGLDHIYLLNNFFIEKLEMNEIELLKGNLGKKIEASKELLEMVERTYKEIIKKNFFKGEYTDNVYKVCYGVAVPSNFADNNAIVLKIYYSKNTKKLNDEEFINNLVKQKELIKGLKERLKKEMEDKLGVPCEVLDEKIPN